MIVQSLFSTPTLEAVRFHPACAMDAFVPVLATNGAMTGSQARCRCTSDGEKPCRARKARANWLGLA